MRYLLGLVALLGLLAVASDASAAWDSPRCGLFQHHANAWHSPTSVRWWGLRSGYDNYYGGPYWHRYNRSPRDFFMADP